MATEKTVLKNVNGDSGIVGLTRKKPALIQWTLTRPIAAHTQRQGKKEVGSPLQTTVFISKKKQHQ